MPASGHRDANCEGNLSPYRFIDANGVPVLELPESAGDPSLLRSLYEAMVFVRTFDQKAVSLQRTGRLGTYASSLGQEAVGVGLASAMHPDDVLFPSFREQGAMLWRGVSPTEILLFWGGDERGNDYQGPRRDFPISIPVASHLPHAAGAALAMQLRREKRVAVAVVGDGGTSKGDFYEAINIAGVWRLPVVFVITNNQWAISVPRHRQTAAATLAEKGVAAGVPNARIDGNDVVAVRHSVQIALDRARASDGPSIIEAVTYRLSDHTTADDAHRYRSDEEVSAHWKEEPIARLRSYLTSAKLWSKSDEETLIRETARKVSEAAESYLATTPEPATAIFDNTFASLPTDLRSWRQALVGDGDGSDG
jgi:2-oxoisovalerate dehydrogenase E1 component alpha subunit